MEPPKKKGTNKIKICEIKDHINSEIIIDSWLLLAIPEAKQFQLLIDTQPFWWETIKINPIPNIGALENKILIFIRI